MAYDAASEWAVAGLQAGARVAAATLAGTTRLAASLQDNTRIVCYAPSGTDEEKLLDVFLTGAELTSRIASRYLGEITTWLPNPWLPEGQDGKALNWLINEGASALRELGGTARGFVVRVSIEMLESVLDNPVGGATKASLGFTAHHGARHLKIYAFIMLLTGVIATYVLLSSASRQPVEIEEIDEEEQPPHVGGGETKFVYLTSSSFAELIRLLTQLKQALADFEASVHV